MLFTKKIFFAVYWKKKFGALINHYPFLNSHTPEAYVVRPTVALVEVEFYQEMIGTSLRHFCPLVAEFWYRMVQRFSLLRTEYTKLTMTLMFFKML